MQQAAEDRSSTNFHSAAQKANAFHFAKLRKSANSCSLLPLFFAAPLVAMNCLKLAIRSSRRFHDLVGCLSNAPSLFSRFAIAVFASIHCLCRRKSGHAGNRRLQIDLGPFGMQVLRTAQLGEMLKKHLGEFGQSTIAIRIRIPVKHRQNRAGGNCWHHLPFRRSAAG